MKQTVSFLFSFLILNTVFAQEVPKANIDYLSFAHGVRVVSVAGSSEELKVDIPKALLAIDGNPMPFIIANKPGGENSVASFVYELPALTTFTQFSIPNVLETPSAYQTFTKNVRVLGSAQSAEDGFELIAETQLSVHDTKGMRTEISAGVVTAIKWLKLELSGGLSVEVDKTWFQFSELEAFGSQEAVPMDERFSGTWKGRGVLIELEQKGPIVSGCYDKTGALSGTVTGNVLQASGVDMHDQTRSGFVLLINDDGRLDGVRSSNGGPFRVYVGKEAADGIAAGCGEPESVSLGCGSTVYGINFDFDSANLRPESIQVIEELYLGQKDEQSSSITIQGHTSSEGSDAYNQKLSERRAQAVVDSLVANGIDQSQISASGLGEANPIASNNDEVGRSLNRRVEVVCAN